MTTISSGFTVQIYEVLANIHYSWFSGVSTQLCRCGARECRGSVGKRSDGKKASPAADELPTKRNKKRDQPHAKKLIRKKPVKASNARIMHPIKAPVKASKKSAGTITLVSPIKAKKPISKAVVPAKPKDKKLSMTTVQRQSKRTIDEKKSTTVSLKKTNSKVFKVTKTYSKKQVTNSQVVKRTLVEEQKPNTKKAKKTIEAQIKNTLQPQTKKQSRKVNTDPVVIEKAVDRAKLPIPKKRGRPRKVSLLCANPDDRSSSEVSSNSRKILNTRKTAKESPETFRGWSVTSDSEDDIIKVTPKQKNIIPRKPSTKKTQTKASKPRGIPPSCSKKPITTTPNDDNDSNADYETEVEASVGKKKKKDRYGGALLAKKPRGRPKGSKSTVKLPKSQLKPDSDLVYPCSAPNGSGGLTSINTGTFYGSTGGIRRAQAYTEMLYQRPVLPLNRALKRSRDDESTGSSDTYRNRRQSSEDTPITELTNSSWSEVDEKLNSSTITNSSKLTEYRDMPIALENQDIENQASKRQKTFPDLNGSRKIDSIPVDGTTTVSDNVKRILGVDHRERQFNTEPEPLVLY